MGLQHPRLKKCVCVILLPDGPYFGCLPYSSSVWGGGGEWIFRSETSPKY